MRPVLLEIEGFGSYRSLTTVDFSGVEIAAIVGSNGAGKSTLFDAIGFALYGEFRGGEIDSVVSSGMDRASVSFTFEVSGAQYRATRNRDRTKGVTRALVEVEDSESPSGWKAVSDESGSVRSATAAVSSVLGANYATMASTVLLGQGDSGRFTTGATATERKEILSEILDLGRYKGYADKAKAKVREHRERVVALLARLEEMESRLAGRSDDEAALRDTERALRGLDAEIAEAQKRLSKAIEAEASVRPDKERFRKATEELDGARSKRREEGKRIEDEVRRATEAVRAAEEVVSSAAVALASARDSADRLNDLHAQVDLLTDDIADLRTRLASAQESRSAAERDAALHAAEIARLDASATELAERAEGMSRNVGGEGECWACQQPLTPEHAERMAAELAEEQKRLADARSKAEGRRADAEAEARRVAQAVNDDERALSELVGRLSSAEKAAAVAASEAAALPERERQSNAAEQRLNEARGVLADAEGRRAGLAEGPSVEESALEEELAGIRERLAAAPDVGAERAAAEAEANRLSSLRERKLVEKGELSGKVSAHEETAKQRDKLRAEAEAEERTEKMYADLAKAFGKDGVPAMILAGVVVELEALVNEELARLSGGQLSVAINTQRQRKGDGGQVETLDIVVAGPDGERSYDTFSGGERFRLDFAVRVGLSRLMSKRSGTPIRMLAIDEGWGALDPDGISAMIDLLRSLQGDFDAILTISHTEAITTAFPTLIEVSKDADGSVVTIT